LDLRNSSGNILTGNTADGNGFYGFQLFGSSGSSGNTLTKNAGCNNDRFDAFQDLSSTGNVFVKNKFCTTDGI